MKNLHELFSWMAKKEAENYAKAQSDKWGHVVGWDVFFQSLRYFCKVINRFFQYWHIFLMIFKHFSLFNERIFFLMRRYCMRHHYCHIMNTWNFFMRFNTIQKISWKIQIFAKILKNLLQSPNWESLSSKKNRTVCCKKLNKLL